MYINPKLGDDAHCSGRRRKPQTRGRRLLFRCTYAPSSVPRHVGHAHKCTARSEVSEFNVYIHHTIDSDIHGRAPAANACMQCRTCIYTSKLKLARLRLEVAYTLSKSPRCAVQMRAIKVYVYRKREEVLHGGNTSVRPKFERCRTCICFPRENAYMSAGVYISARVQEESSLMRTILSPMILYRLHARVCR